MRFALALAAALVAAGISNVSFAADRAPAGGQVSHDVLADMGLGEMQVLSDHDGQTVRGRVVWLTFLFPAQPFNPAATGNFIIHQGLDAVVHFPEFRGFAVAPTGF